jgi:hypothetical protein
MDRVGAVGAAADGADADPVGAGAGAGADADEAGDPVGLAAGRAALRSPLRTRSAAGGSADLPADKACLLATEAARPLMPRDEVGGVRKVAIMEGAPALRLNGMRRGTR